MMKNDRGQTLINKYVWVIDTIYRAGKISFRELNRRWVRDEEISEGVELAKRTFDNWRYAIRDMFKLDIENENCGEYRYYIENEQDIFNNGLSSWLINTICVSNVWTKSESIKDRILLEYVPSGQEHLQTIIEAMKEGKVLNMTYHSYWKDEENSFDVDGWWVRRVGERGYGGALRTCSYYQQRGPRIYALDRIQDLQQTEESFEMPKDWNAEEYFEGCFGVIADHHTKIQTVKLKVSAGQANYIRDLALHESQKERERTEEYSIFTYRLRPTFDFQ